MKDVAELAKAVVVPYIAICSVTTICWLWGTAQDIPQLLWVIFVGSLGELGIEIGIKKVVKK